MTKIRSRSSGRVRDRRGSGGGYAGRTAGSPFGSRGGPGRLPIKAGGGVIGLLVVVAIIVLPRILGSESSPIGPAAQVEDSGPAACESELEQIVCGAVDDVSVYWEGQYPLSFQGTFPGTDTVFFSGATSTGCGRASAQTGPFYCPADQLVYFDLEFLAQLQERFAATGDLAAQYIVAHEYGHHVQNVTGIADRVGAAQRSRPSATNGLSVAQELQADCFAGTWARSVADRGLLERPEEIGEALGAAEAVGDDRILESSGQDVDPESFTHGSAEQRRSWFEQGFETGDPEACSTFDGSLAP
ncbi:KPN_02809 family neutral zinc metallopeptidase [Ilumatobacter sp.]|uniref:KPN_02809 family neutral zinc metallopeptidase n=1 Tax=Ilumatobacter sp. TaxID=1967498 RepID=UPI003C516770